MASLGESATPEAVDKQVKEIQGLVESATGIDAKRGDRVAVSAVDFVQGGALDEAVAGPGILEQLLQQTGALVKGLTILAATALLIFFGLKPALRAILSHAPVPAVPAAGGAPQLASEGGASAELPGGSERRNLSREVEPNLIADLTSKMGRSPQKRLEQMIDYDEEQAAAILKQWMRGANAA
jgi:flagellar M-ring protein FliF